MCILNCIEDIMQFMNTYAFVHCAMYGSDFCSGGSMAWDLIMTSGFDMIINDDLTNMALMVSAFGAGVLGGGITWVTAHATTMGSAAASAMGFVGFFVTFGCCALLMALAHSCVATIYVCYSEKPAEGAEHHPEEVQALVDAWREAYSGMNWVQVGGIYRINNANAM